MKVEYKKLDGSLGVFESEFDFEKIETRDVSLPKIYENFNVLMEDFYNKFVSTPIEEDFEVSPHDLYEALIKYVFKTTTSLSDSRKLFYLFLNETSISLLTFLYKRDEYKEIHELLYKRYEVEPGVFYGFNYLFNLRSRIYFYDITKQFYEESYYYHEDEEGPHYLRYDYLFSTKDKYTRNQTIIDLNVTSNEANQMIFILTILFDYPSIYEWSTYKRSYNLINDFVYKIKDDRTSSLILQNIFNIDSYFKLKMFLRARKHFDIAKDNAMKFLDMLN